LAASEVVVCMRADDLYAVAEVPGRAEDGGVAFGEDDGFAGLDGTEGGEEDVAGCGAGVGVRPAGHVDGSGTNVCEFDEFAACAGIHKFGDAHGAGGAWVIGDG